MVNVDDINFHTDVHIYVLISFILLHHLLYMRSSIKASSLKYCTLTAFLIVRPVQHMEVTKAKLGRGVFFAARLNDDDLSTCSFRAHLKTLFFSFY